MKSLITPREFVDRWSQHYKGFSSPSREAYNDELHVISMYFSTERPVEFLEILEIFLKSDFDGFGREVFAAGPLEEFLINFGETFLDELAMLNARHQSFAPMLSDTQDRSDYSEGVRRFIDYAIGDGNQV